MRKLILDTIKTSGYSKSPVPYTGATVNTFSSFDRLHTTPPLQRKEPRSLCQLGNFKYHEVGQTRGVQSPRAPTSQQIASQGELLAAPTKPRSAASAPLSASPQARWERDGPGRPRSEPLPSHPRQPHHLHERSGARHVARADVNLPRAPALPHPARARYAETPWNAANLLNPGCCWGSATRLIGRFLGANRQCQRMPPSPSPLQDQASERHRNFPPE